MRIEKLSPAFKDYLWGGTKLKTEFGKQSDLDIVAGKLGAFHTHRGRKPYLRRPVKRDDAERIFEKSRSGRFGEKRRGV